MEERGNCIRKSENIFMEHTASEHHKRIVWGGGGGVDMNVIIKTLR